MEPARILVAVSGGIAAFKVPDLVRSLQREGHEVRCAATPAALRFVSPLTPCNSPRGSVRSALLRADSLDDRWDCRFVGSRIASLPGVRL